MSLTFQSIADGTIWERNKILQYACLFRYKVHARLNMELYHITLCRVVTCSCMVLIFCFGPQSREVQSVNFLIISGYFIRKKKPRKFIVICFHSSRTFLEKNALSIKQGLTVKVILKFQYDQGTNCFKFCLILMFQRMILEINFIPMKH